MKSGGGESSLKELVGGSLPAATRSAIAEADECLKRFMEAFNAQDAAGMEAQLVLPRLMLSDKGGVVWRGPGSHAPGLFARLKKAGWKRNCYESIEPVLVAPGKVHFVVSYTRRGSDDTILSRHSSLWTVVRRGGAWRLSLHSY